MVITIRGLFIKKSISLTLLKLSQFVLNHFVGNNAGGPVINNCYFIVAGA